MRLTVLGAFGPYPPAGGACSGYLLENDGDRILIDCGNGVLSRLQKYLAPWELDAIVISHLHNDHISDLFILRYAQLLAQKRGDTDQALDLYLPEGPEEEVSRIPGGDVYRMIFIRPQQLVRIRSFCISFLPTIHPLPCLAMKIEAGEKKLVYSGDTEYYDELISFAHGCDLFLCEANFQEEDLLASRPNHLSASQAGKIAREAGVKRLLLTHLPPDRPLALSVKEARREFASAELAVEGQQYIIS